ncbi:MAG: SH3 domain-containing protein [Syntrophothermus sp.]
MPVATETALPSPAQPTLAPVEGTTSTQVNVRAEPSTTGGILGIIPANTRVQITGKDPAGNWWQILYPQGQEGKGWVTSQYVSAANGTVVPVIGGGPDAGTGSTAVIQQQINVRSGPGTSFNSLGTLNARDVVRLTGKDPNSTWLQIEFQSGPDGKGWVNAAFVQATGVESLPIITEGGTAVGTGTPTGIPPTPTITVIPAWEDNDSQDHPIASVILEPQGTQTLIYRGDVSSPQGDPQDWIRFTSYKDVVFASLHCSQTSHLMAGVFENGRPTSIVLACGDSLKPIPVKTNTVYTIHVQAAQFSGGVQYTPYTIRIQTSP